jgi:HK97 family phage portal protein
MKNVNPFSNQFDLFELTELFLELTGHAYWYLVKDLNGLPTEVWVLPSQNMKVIPDKEKFIKGYVYINGMEKIPYEEEEIIHFKFPTPGNVYYGCSPLSAVSQAYNINENMNVFENALFSNMARPEGVLETDEEIGDADFTRISKEWIATYGGVSKVGKTALLDKGLHYKAITITPRELNFLNGRTAVRDEIGSAYGLPKSKLTTDDVNRANAEAGNYSYMVDTILPRCRRIQEKINEKLMSQFDSSLFVAFDNPIPEDQNFKLKEKEINLKTGYSSINLERKRNGEAPVPWGDVPFNVGKEPAPPANEEPKKA